MCYKSGTVSRQNFFLQIACRAYSRARKATLLLLMSSSARFGAYSQTWFLGWYNNCKFFKYEVF
jgi:hypothetical protein